MPRPRPPHLHRQITRHGRAVWYVRIGKGKRIRLRSDFGTDDFRLEYEAAIVGRPLSAKGAAAGTLQWLYDRYRETGSWTKLSLATRRQRENIFRPVMERAGSADFRAINQASILAGIDQRSNTPSQARHFLEAMKGLFKWAKGKHVKTDPTAGIETPRGPKTQGFPAWTETDVEAFESRWPIGTRQRVWLDVLLYTGLRLGDAVRLGRQHVRDGMAHLTTEKTDTPVFLPMLPVLLDTLRAGPTGDLAFICGQKGAPLSKEGFGNLFSEAARMAGVKKSAHGVRKIAATRAAEKGATVSELEAIFGWSGGRMASLYTRTADRRRLAKGAMDKLATSIPSPDDKVRAASKKPE
jgi:integrase